MGPPDDASDEAWRLLWDRGRLPHSQHITSCQLTNGPATLFAEIPAPDPTLMPAKSIPIPSTNGTRHVVGIDVFHQLHCLDSLRKRLRPARYPDPDWPMRGSDLGHPDHCVESLRMYLMCTADVSAVSWVWQGGGEGEGEGEGKWVTSTTEHTCRKWDRIWEWGLRHRRVHDLDRRIELGGWG
ncbi:hypothetical protein CC86DRAFT_377089 [Ophiobolus disseminans]|uniref:Uncharacterized protein n=1 Tax=Ophiobolus disseminans TaxID=1469910 RepID=A0A6A7ANQ3_9PLEO|nr:hypothetical protein CC86DRAFT_377089 [Ophiobolus disseminans]